MLRAGGIISGLRSAAKDTSLPYSLAKEFQK